MAAVSRPTDAAVAALLDALADTSGPPPSIAGLARDSGLSVFQLIRRFRAALGATPTEYRVHLRARHARDLLAGTRTIGEVAHLAGYADQSHLNRHFKRVFGITPGAYRGAIRRLRDPSVRAERRDLGLHRRRGERQTDERTADPSRCSG